MDILYKKCLFVCLYFAAFRCGFIVTLKFCFVVFCFSIIWNLLAFCISHFA